MSKKRTRRLTTVLLAVLLSATLAGCESQPSEENLDGEAVLEKIIAANAADMILKEHESFSTQFMVFDADDKETWHVDAFLGEDHCSYVEKGDSHIAQIAIGDGVSYVAGNYPDEGVEKFLFIGEELYAEYYDYYAYFSTNIMYPAEHEEVISNELNEEGRRVILTHAVADENVESNYENAAAVECIYIVDPESYLMEGETAIIKDAEGNELGRQEFVRTYDVESSVFDELRSKIEGSGEQRTVTAIDVESGEKYSTTMNKGVTCYFVPPEGASLYSDEGCTIEYDGEVDLESDETVYVKMN